MKHTPTFIVMIAIPLYVMGAFVTSVFAPHWGSNKDEVPVYQSVVLSFVGDMMFDRYIREKAEVGGYDAILFDILPYFASSTFVIGNLEGPITTFTPVSDYRDQGPNHYRFTFATTVADVLSDAGFSAVTVANNHILNFGNDGLEQTKNWLLANGIDYLGAPDDSYTPWRTATSGHEVVVYAYDPWHAKNTESVAARIGKESEDAFVVVFAHWGDEYDTVPNKGQREIAHEFIDAGADLIVGSHPHVLQGKEEYKGVWIYYSLGNFVFDQYFSADVRCGGVLHVTLAEDGSYTTSESFVELARDGTTKQSDCASDVQLLTE